MRLLIRIRTGKDERQMSGNDAVFTKSNRNSPKNLHFPSGYL